MDDLRAVHAKYVGSMVTRCFLNPKAAAFLQLLLGSVETAVAFCHAASSQDSYLASIKSREFAKLTRKFVKSPFVFCYLEKTLVVLVMCVFTVKPHPYCQRNPVVATHFDYKYSFIESFVSRFTVIRF